MAQPASEWRLAEAFAAGGRGVIATAGRDGTVNLAVYARPHLIDERTVAWGMTDGRTWTNVRENPRAAYLFMHPDPGWSGVRLGLILKEVQATGSLLDAVRASTARMVGDAAAAVVHRVVVFQVVEVRPLI